MNGNVRTNIGLEATWSYLFIYITYPRASSDNDDDNDVRKLTKTITN